MAEQTLAQAEALAGAQRWAEAAAAYVVCARALDGDSKSMGGTGTAAVALRAGRGLVSALLPKWNQRNTGQKFRG